MASRGRVFWVVAGLALAGLGVGGFFFVRHVWLRDDVDRAVDDYIDALEEARAYVEANKDSFEKIPVDEQRERNRLYALAERIYAAENADTSEPSLKAMSNALGFSTDPSWSDEHRPPANDIETFLAKTCVLGDVLVADEPLQPEKPDKEPMPHSIRLVQCGQLFGSRIRGLCLTGEVARAEDETLALVKLVEGAGYGTGIIDAMASGLNRVRELGAAIDVASYSKNAAYFTARLSALRKGRLFPLRRIMQFELSRFVKLQEDVDRKSIVAQTRRSEEQGLTMTAYLWGTAVSLRGLTQYLKNPSSAAKLDLRSYREVTNAMLAIPQDGSHSLLVTRKFGRVARQSVVYEDILWFVLRNHRTESFLQDIGDAIPNVTMRAASIDNKGVLVVELEPSSVAPDIDAAEATLRVPLPR